MKVLDFCSYYEEVRKEDLIDDFLATKPKEIVKSSFTDWVTNRRKKLIRRSKAYLKRHRGSNEG